MKKLKKNMGITLIALVVTIVVLLILAGISISMLGGENGIITKAQETKEENRGGTVEEKRDLWFSNVKADENTNLNTAQTLDEVLAELKNEGLLADEEIEYIKQNGYIQIGSHLIDFRLEGNEIDWSKMEPGLYETGTRNMIKSWKELKNEGYIYVENNKLMGIYSNIPEGDLIISPEIEGLNAFNNLCGGTINTPIIGLYIPSSVKIIPNFFMFNFERIEKIILENGVESIGERAFWLCEKLISIEIPSSITSIENYTFSGCSNLKNIKFSNSITSIGNGAFSWCSSLTSIEIPSSVISIGNGAFKGCSNLTSISVDSQNITYDSRDNCNAIIEKSTNTLLYGCKNTTIPDNVINIGDEAFYDCSGLTSIEIHNSVISIGEFTFYNCINLKNIKIQNNMKEIGESAFYGCNNLTTVNYTGTKAEWNTLVSSISSGNNDLTDAKIICTDGEIN